MEGVFDIHCQSKAVADFLNSQGRLEPQTLMIIIRENLQGCLQPEVKFSFGKKVPVVVLESYISFVVIQPTNFLLRRRSISNRY